jgi:hypothetical protein
MVHQQYREWALSEEPLAPAQQRELQNHMQACPECHQWQLALAQVQSRFKDAAMVSAPEGFADRFRVRLAAAKAGRQRRQAWLVLGLNLFGSLVLMGLLAYATLTNLAEILAQLLKGFLSFGSQLAIMRELALGFLSFLPSPAGGLFGASLLVALAGAALALYAGLGGLWAAAVYRFAYVSNRKGGSQ